MEELAFNLRIHSSAISSSSSSSSSSAQGPPIAEFSFEYPSTIFDRFDLDSVSQIALDDQYIVDPDETELTSDQTFDMIDIGIQRFQDLHKHSKMKKLQKNFLDKIYKNKRNDRAMFHCQCCKQRHLTSEPSKRVGPNRMRQCRECVV